MRVVLALRKQWHFVQRLKGEMLEPEALTGRAWVLCSQVRQMVRR